MSRPRSRYSSVSLKWQIGPSRDPQFVILADTTKDLIRELPQNRRLSPTELDSEILGNPAYPRYVIDRILQSMLGEENKDEEAIRICLMKFKSLVPGITDHSITYFYELVSRVLVVQPDHLFIDLLEKHKQSLLYQSFTLIQLTCYKHSQPAVELSTKILLFLDHSLRLLMEGNLPANSKVLATALGSVPELLDVVGEFGKYTEVDELIELVYSLPKPDQIQQALLHFHSAKDEVPIYRQRVRRSAQTLWPGIQAAWQGRSAVVSTDVRNVGRFQPGVQNSI